MLISNVVIRVGNIQSLVFIMLQDRTRQCVERNEISELLGRWILDDIRINDSFSGEHEVVNFFLAEFKVN